MAAGSFVVSIYTAVWFVLPHHLHIHSAGQGEAGFVSGWDYDAFDVVVRPVWNGGYVGKQGYARFDWSGIWRLRRVDDADYPDSVGVHVCAGDYVFQAG